MAVLHHPGGAIAAMQRGMYLANFGWFWALFCFFELFECGLSSGFIWVLLVDLIGFFSNFQKKRSEPQRASRVSRSVGDRDQLC